MLSTLERRIVAVVLLLGVLMLAGVVVLLVRWEDVKAWLDAPEVLRVNTAALEVPLPEGAEEDPTRSACGQQGALRCAWTPAAPQEAVDGVVSGLRALDVEVENVVCGDDALPSAAMLGSEIACGARVPLRDAELWVLATDVTPSGRVPLGRTALWFAWNTADMSWPLFERIVEADPYPYPFVDPESGEPHPATPEEVRDALPERYVGVTDHCWAGVEEDPVCTIWEAPVDVADLPAEGQVEALVRELVAAGFFVDAADASWGGEPLRAHRFTVPGGWTGVQVTVRPDGDGLVAQVHAL